MGKALAVCYRRPFFQRLRTVGPMGTKSGAAHDILGQT